VVVEPKQVQHENYKAIKPILDLVGNRRGIMISPMPRYWSKPCCDSVDHVKNIKDSTYKTVLSASLKEAKQNLKDFLFSEGRRNFRVLDPNIDIQCLKEEDVWGSDPVHPLPAVFSRIAEGVAKTVAMMRESADRKRSNEDEPATAGDSRRFRGASYNLDRPQERDPTNRGRGSNRGHPGRWQSRGAGGFRGHRGRGTGYGSGYPRGSGSRRGGYY
jgi:hypothetical protein